MAFSNRSSLALATILAIAHHGSKEFPIGAAMIEEQYALNRRALEPILQWLVRLKLVVSVRGVQGGYYVQSPEKLTVGAVLRALDVSILPSQPMLLLQPILEAALTPAHEAFLKKCDAITFAMLSEQAQRAGIAHAFESMLDFAI